MLDKEKLEIYNLNCFQNYESVDYELKKGGIIHISPILVKDFLIYQSCIEVLSIDKDSINDIEVFQMSYLQFLYERMIKQDTSKNYENKLHWICFKCLGYEYVSFNYDKGKVVLCLLNKVNNDLVLDKVITPKEFDEIIQIIFHQNDKKYEEREYSNDVKKLIAKFLKDNSKGKKNPTLEDKLNFVTSKNGILSKDLKNITYREFQGIYDSCIDSEIFMSRKIIQASYKYSVEDFQHPLFEPDKDITDLIFGGTTESFINNINK